MDQASAESEASEEQPSEESSEDSEEESSEESSESDLGIPMKVVIPNLREIGQRPMRWKINRHPPQTVKVEMPSLKVQVPPFRLKQILMHF